MLRKSVVRQYAGFAHRPACKLDGTRRGLNCRNIVPNFRLALWGFFGRPTRSWCVGASSTETNRRTRYSMRANGLRYQNPRKSRQWSLKVLEQILVCEVYVDERGFRPQQLLRRVTCPIDVLKIKWGACLLSASWYRCQATVSDFQLVIFLTAVSDNCTGHYPGRRMTWAVFEYVGQFELATCSNFTGSVTCYVVEFDCTSRALFVSYLSPSPFRGRDTLRYLYPSVRSQWSSLGPDFGSANAPSERKDYHPCTCRAIPRDPRKKPNDVEIYQKHSSRCYCISGTWRCHEHRILTLTSLCDPSYRRGNLWV